jgi:hypothetical protein
MVTMLSEKKTPNSDNVELSLEMFKFGIEKISSPICQHSDTGSPLMSKELLILILELLAVFQDP